MRNKGANIIYGHDIAAMQKAAKPEMISKIAKSGLMFRLFCRVKTIESIRHKMGNKGYLYLSGKTKMQDIIGLRIVVYFPDDIEVLSTYFGCGEVVKESIDTPDDSTFRPKRLNITRRLPDDYETDFRAALPKEYADIIDSTYEIQIIICSEVIT